MRREYVANGERVVLESDPTVVAVRFREPAPHSMRASVAEAHALGPYHERYEVPREKYTLLPIADAPTAAARVSRAADVRQRDEGAEGRVGAAVAELNAATEVERATPVFRHRSTRVVATDRILIGFAPDTPDPKGVLKTRGYEVLTDRGNGEFVARIGASEDPFDAAEALAARPDVTYAEPDFVVIGSHTPKPPANPPAQGGQDPLSTKQYALGLTRANDAQQLLRGDPAVRIAVLDEGVDTTHEDLRVAVAGSYDAAEDDVYQEPNAWDGHGTSCAGLAAAVASNGVGVRGIGAGCSILAVRIAYSEKPGHDWTTTNDWIVRGIDWAWRNGAAVLSNSWGGGPPSTAIRNAFERARTLGRQGRGAVVVIAAGNDSAGVNFPATLSDVLAVSASNEFDEPKTKTSQDGETWWGTCFGAEVSLAAPGVHNVTTDITGKAGYNRAAGSAGNYYDAFNGTSSATPLVAGAAALLLSARPELREAQVRRILCDTADKVGPVPYAQGRNDYMGFGRLNVLRALETALGGPGPHAAVASAP